MDRLKAPFRVINTFALLVIAYALLVNPSSAAPSAGPLAAPMSPGFEYEGRLGNLTGSYDFKFRLFGVPTGGSPVYVTTAVATDVPVANGEYRTVLRFGEGITSVLTGEALYVDVQYRVATTNTNAPYTTQTGTRAQLLPQAYAMSLRPGAQVRGNVAGAGLFVNNTGNGTGVAGQSKGGAGTTGQSNTWYGVYGLSSTQAGVRGDSTSGSGVWGKSLGGAGVRGESRDLNGVYGTSTMSDGVQGMTAAAGKSGVVGIHTNNGYGVYGTSSNGHGVFGIVGNPNMSGVWATNTGGGNALSVSGNAAQSLSGGGLIKAMALIDPFDQADPVKQCFNSQLPGTQTTSGNCGISTLDVPACSVAPTINFGFDLTNRIFTITPIQHSPIDIVANIEQITTTGVTIGTYYNHSPTESDFYCAEFFIVVY